MAICLSKEDVPPAKSIVQRLLVIQYLAGNIPIAMARGADRQSLADYLGVPAWADQFSDDTINLWQALNCLLTTCESGVVPILECGAGGTTVRFLVALAAVIKRPFGLTGCQRLGQRPLEPLLGNLAELGITHQWHGSKSGDWPLMLRPQTEIETSSLLPDVLSIDCSKTSQFLSALMLVAPYLPNGLNIKVQGRVVSWPYVTMTAELMRDFGAQVSISAAREVVIAPGRYLAQNYSIPGDWSAIAFILAASWLSGQAVEFTMHLPDRGQGDRVFSELLAKMVTKPSILDLSDCPDLLPVLTGCALFVGHRTQFVGIAHTELKESPRASLLAAELKKVGAIINFDGQSLEVQPNSLHGGVLLDSHGDHRLAMTMALLSLRLPGVKLTDTSCVSKSFPRFFDILPQFKKAL